MSKKRKTIYKEYVNHPRYGDRPISSGSNFSRDEILKSWWGYDGEIIFPESAIEADVARQNYSVFPRSLYVDIEKQCMNCNRSFIFFAHEQKYWYEDLNFIIDADCVKCVECRIQEQRLRLLVKEYEVLTKNMLRSAEETVKLKELASKLHEIGYIKNKRKIGQIT
jgi:hypothetical protein